MKFKECTEPQHLTFHNNKDCDKKKIFFHPSRKDFDIHDNVQCDISFSCHFPIVTFYATFLTK